MQQVGSWALTCVHTLLLNVSANMQTQLKHSLIKLSKTFIISYRQHEDFDSKD